MPSTSPAVRTIPPDAQCPSTLALLPGDSARDTLRVALLAALGPPIDGRISFCENAEALLSMAHTLPPAMVVARDDPQQPDLIMKLRSRLPTAALVAWLPSESARRVRKLVKDGVDAIVLGDETRDPAAVADHVIHARTDSLIRTAGPALRILASPSLMPFLEALLRKTCRPVDIKEAADIFCATPETLRRHLGRSRLPPVRKLITWFRLLHAAFLLDDRARTVENVALTLDFPSRTALENQFRRYTGRTPTSLRRRGAVDAVLEEFDRRHREGVWTLS